MDNKNGKTFSDLLLHSEDDKNSTEENSNVSLMNLLSSQENDSDDSSVADVNEEDIDDIKEDNVDNNEDTSDESSDETLELNDEVKVEDKLNEDATDNIKEDDVDSDEDTSDESSDEALELNDEVKVEDKLNEDANLFFDNSNDVSSNNQQEEDNQDEKDLNDVGENLFFDNSNEQIDDKDEEVENNQDNDVVSNHGEEATLGGNENMFFENNVDEDKTSDDDFQDVDLGVSFGKSEDENNEIKPKDIEKNEEEVPSSDSILNSVEDKSDKNEEDKFEPSSDNPFFDDSGDDNNLSQEDNPLFLNTLNLVESDDMKKKVEMIDSSKSKHFNVKVVKKKEPLFKVIIGIISYALFIWLLFIGVTLLIYVLDIKIRAYKGDYSTPTYNAYVVLTGSMLPEIQVYDVVVTKKTDPAKLKVGDVITFASADTRFLGTTITHRIIKKNYVSKTKSYEFQTKGDNNNVADNALVPENNIYGRVMLKIPKLGYLQEFLATDGGWIIVILLPCLAVISYDIVKLAKGLKKKKYKNIKVQK